MLVGCRCPLVQPDLVCYGQLLAEKYQDQTHSNDLQHNLT